MAEDKTKNPYPFPTSEDAFHAPGLRADKGARNIVSRRIEGIPKRAYIMGENDHAPVVKGVRDLVETVYVLLDRVEKLQHTGEDLDADLVAAADRIRLMLEDHRCQEVN